MYLATIFIRTLGCNKTNIPFTLKSQVQFGTLNLGLTLLAFQVKLLGQLARVTISGVAGPTLVVCCEQGSTDPKTRRRSLLGDAV